MRNLICFLFLSSITYAQTIHIESQSFDENPRIRVYWSGNNLGDRDIEFQFAVDADFDRILVTRTRAADDLAPVTVNYLPGDVYIRAVVLTATNSELAISNTSLVNLEGAGEPLPAIDYRYELGHVPSNPGWLSRATLIAPEDVTASILVNGIAGRKLSLVPGEPAFLDLIPGNVYAISSPSALAVSVTYNHQDTGDQSDKHVPRWSDCEPCSLTLTHGGGSLGALVIQNPGDNSRSGNLTFTGVSGRESITGEVLVDVPAGDRLILIPDDWWLPGHDRDGDPVEYAITLDGSGLILERAVYPNCLLFANWSRAVSP